MKFTHRPSLIALVALAIGAMTAAPAFAVPTTHVGPTVQIDYDPDTFVFERNPGGGLGVTTLASAEYTANASGDSASVSFGGNLFASASSSFNFSPEDSFGKYLANFTFSALPGHVITGYDLTFNGTYNIEHPGTVSVSGPGAFAYFNSTGGFNAPWNHTESFVGGTIPAIDGIIQASALIDTIEIPGVVVGFEQMNDPGDLDCNGIFDDGICGTVDDPSRPIYDPPPRTETDLGDASITIGNITVAARTAPVPEPSTFALAGVGLVGWLIFAKKRKA